MQKKKVRYLIPVIYMGKSKWGHHNLTDHLPVAVTDPCCHK